MDCPAVDIHRALLEVTQRAENAPLEDRLGILHQDGAVGTWASSSIKTS